MVGQIRPTLPGDYKFTEFATRLRPGARALALALSTEHGLLAFIRLMQLGSHYERWVSVTILSV